MKRLHLDRPPNRGELVVHLSLGASVVAALILATGTMLEFTLNLDGVTRRLASPPAGVDPGPGGGEVEKATNLASRRGLGAGLQPVIVTNAQPSAGQAAPRPTTG